MAVRTEIDLKDVKLEKKESKEPKKKVRIDNSLLRQASAYSFKHEDKDILTNLQNQEAMNMPDLYNQPKK